MCANKAWILQNSFKSLLLIFLGLNSKTKQTHQIFNRRTTILIWWRTFEDIWHFNWLVFKWHFTSFVTWISLIRIRLCQKFSFFKSFLKHYKTLHQHLSLIEKKLFMFSGMSRIAKPALKYQRNKANWLLTSWSATCCYILFTFLKGHVKSLVNIYN